MSHAEMLGEADAYSAVLQLGRFDESTEGCLLVCTTLSDKAAIDTGQNVTGLRADSHCGIRPYVKALTTLCM